MLKPHNPRARPPRARIQNSGGGGTTKRLALLALALLAALSALAVDLAPSRAQQNTVSRVVINEDNILGSFGVRSYFIVLAEVYDGNGDGFHGGSPGWSPNAWQLSPISMLIQGANVFYGRAYASYQVTRPGPVTITLTVGGQSDSVTLQLGEEVASRPPEPSSILLAAPYELRTNRNHPDQVTVTALITDANGAAVPDGTPVEWELWRFQDRPWPRASLRVYGEFWLPISVDRTTTNGAATGTWRKAYTANETDPVLVIARAGPAVGSVIAEANRRLWARTDRPARVEIIEAPSRWESVPVGEPVTLRARLLNLYGDPVSNTAYSLKWRFHEYGHALAEDRPEIITRANSGAVNDALPNSDGIASTTYTPRYPGTVWVRAYETTGGATRILLDTVAFHVGDYYPPPDDLALNLRLLDDSDDLVPTGSTLRVGADLTYSGNSQYEQALHVTSGALRVVGSLQWEAGRNRLDAPGQSALTRRTVLIDHFAYHSGRVGHGAQYGANEGQCKGVSEDGETNWTCALDFGDGAAITILPGTPVGVYTISVTLNINGREYSDMLEVTVVEPGSIDEVAEVRFDFAPRERGASRGEPYPSTIAAGESTKLRLTALNENSAASAGGSISTILLTTTSGRLSTSIGGGCEGGGGMTCRVPVSAVGASNADQIPITLAHPGAGGARTATVRARVISSEGEVFRPPPLRVTFKGAAAALAISEPATGLLGAATSGDDRDLLKLTVTAADASGNEVEVPYRAPRAVIRGPDGKQVSSGIGVVWTEDGPDDDEAHDRFARNAAGAVEAVIRTTAAADFALKAGEYTLELRTDGKVATRTFRVVGVVDSATLGEPQGVLQAGRVVSLSATFRDAEGAPAPDGTRVEWGGRDVGVSAVLVRLSADPVTSDGTATAVFMAVSGGAAIVTARADGVGDARLVSIAAAPAAVGGGAAARLSDSLTNSSPGGYSAWLGGEATTASALFGELAGSGVGVIMFWRDGGWLRYAGADSVDFTIEPGVVLWLDY